MTEHPGQWRSTGPGPAEVGEEGGPWALSLCVLPATPSVTTKVPLVTSGGRGTGLAFQEQSHLPRHRGEFRSLGAAWGGPAPAQGALGEHSQPSTFSKALSQ